MFELYWRQPEKKRVFDATYLESNIPIEKNLNSYLAASDDPSQVAILTANTCAYIHRHKRWCVLSPHLCAASPITLTFAPSQFTWSLQEMMVDEDLTTWQRSGIHNWTSFKKLTLGIWLERNPPPELQACCSRNYCFFAPSTGTSVKSSLILSRPLVVQMLTIEKVSFR